MPEPAPKRYDPSILGILTANAFTLATGLWQDWPLMLMLWPYWLQSLVIGFYSRRRILLLQRFSTEGLSIGNRPADPTPATQRQIADFFALHYGFFHAIYLIFLAALTFSGDFGRAPAPVDWLLFVVLGIPFLLSHRRSHRLNIEIDLRGEPNLGSLMFLPYARVLPMHLTIIFGAMLGGGKLALLLFLVLKTGADVVMHVIEHRWLQRTNGRKGSRFNINIG